jgi:hypothetical protein
MSTPWAREGPLPAKKAIAATSRANARVIFLPLGKFGKKIGLGKTGHIGRGFASHAGVSPQGFRELRLKMLCFTVWSSNAGVPL